MGALDVDGDSCFPYTDFPEYCGGYDNEEFNSDMENTNLTVEQWQKEDKMKASEQSEDIQKAHNLQKKYEKK